MPLRAQHSTTRLRQVSTTIVAALLLVSAAVTFSGSLTAFAASQTQFTYTGSEQSWTVPTDVVAVEVVAVGGAGGTSCSCSAGQAGGGHGATVDATIPVTPGETLYVEVGGTGANGTGTFNGGGGASDFGGNYLSGEGGGATDLRAVAMAAGGTLNSRLVVAGGGGGGGGTLGPAAVSAGGDAGADAGNASGACTAGGGGAGTLSSGGAAGVAAGSSDGENIQGVPGAFGDGGSGYETGTGGGGGGGYYGGGSGSGCQNGAYNPYSGSGGGGGSSFVTSSATTSSLGLDSTGIPELSLTWTVLPAVSSVSADGGPTVGGSSVTITGSDFTGTTVVDFGATLATSFTVVSGTEITAVTPGPHTGVVDVTVTNPNGTSQITSADEFTFEAAPTVTGLSPASGATSGGAAVTLAGTNFTAATTVDFGTTPAMSFAVVSPTEITAHPPASSPGVVDVQVSTPSGTSAITPADDFTFTAAVVATVPDTGAWPPNAPLIPFGVLTLLGMGLIALSFTLRGRSGRRRGAA
jgi:IPT/TIG domain-containing protein/glycine rich protein